MKDVTSIHYEGERNFKQIANYDMTIIEFKDAQDAFADLDESGLSVWALLKQENPDYDLFKLTGSWIIVKLLTFFISYKMKKFTRKYPEYTL